MSDTPQIAVKILSGPEAGQLFVVEKASFIGSAAHCDIHLPSSGLADMHARIGVRGNIFTLTDLTEEADIRVNNSRVKSRRLTIGDIINIADVRMEVCNPRDALAATTVLEEYENDDGDAIRVLSAEANPKTEIERPVPVVVENEGFADPSQPSPESQGDESVEPASALDLRKQRISQKRTIQHQKSKGKPAIGIFIAVFFGLVVAVAFIARSMTERQELAAAYMEVTEFAEANAGNQEAVLARYREFKKTVGVRSTAITMSLDAEIRKIEGAMQAMNTERRDVLASLDKRADDLLDKMQFDEAIEVYRTAPLKRRSEVAVLRKDKIEGIAEQKEKQLAQVEREKNMLEEQRTLISKQRSEKALEQLAVDVVNALLASRSEVAVDLMEEAIEDDLNVPEKTRLESVLSMVRLLNLHDKLLKVKVEAGEALPDKDEVRSGLSPVARTILFIRDGDLLAAQSVLKKIEGHMLEPALNQRVSSSAGDLAVEKKAMVEFIMIWRKIVGVPETKIPKPEACIAVIEKEMQNEARKDIKELCSRLIACRGKYAATAFVERYASVFNFANRQYPSMLVNDPTVTDVGNGKVIQVDGTKCFVESVVDVDGFDDGQVALFIQDETYYSVDGKRTPLGARINVTSVYPFKALGKKQLIFDLGDGAIAPSIRQSVLIGSKMLPGFSFVPIASGSDRSGIVAEDFAVGIDEKWRASSGGRMVHKDGKLVFSRDGSTRGLDNKKMNALTGMGHLERVVDIGRDAIGLSLELVRDSVGGVSIALGDLSFVVGTDGSYKEGIYHDGRLVMPADLAGDRYGAVEHIEIRCFKSSATLTVNGNSVRYGIRSTDYGKTLDRIRFFAYGTILIDNFRLADIDVADVAFAQVVGLTKGGEEVVVSKGGGVEWKMVGKGHPVYFFRKNLAGEPKPLLAGRVEFVTGKYLICKVPKGDGLDGSCLVSAVNQYKERAVAGLRPTDPWKARDVVADSVSYAKVLENKDGKFQLQADLPVSFSPQGYLYSIGSILKHPKSGEVLAASVGVGAKIPLSQYRAVVSGGVPSVVPAFEFKSGVLLSQRALKLGVLSDVRGWRQTSLRSGYSRLNFRKGIWTVNTKNWELMAGGRLMTSLKKTAGYPMLPSTHSMSGNFQCDINIRIESVSEEQPESWVKDIMVEVFSPAIMGGVTFGLGGAESGGLWIGGRSLSLPKTRSLTQYMNFPRSSKVAYGDAWVGSVPPLGMGKEYTIRVRRLGDLLLFYLNGRRIATVRTPELTGDVQVIFGAPRMGVSVGRASLRDIPWSCKAVEKEGEFGDFGYVLKTEGQRIWVDADMHGIASNGKITVMMVDNIIKGESSKTVILKKVASGVVVELGERTAEVVLSAANSVIQPGMKVMSGDQPDSLLVTDEWLRDIDNGL